MWAAIIVAVTLLGRWAFSVDTYAQEGGGPTPTVTPTSLLDEEGDGETKEKREYAPNCEEPFNADHPNCSGYVPIADRTPTPRPEPIPTMRPGECSPFDDDCSPAQRPTATRMPGNSCPPHQTCVTPEPTEETEEDTPTPTDTPTDTPTPTDEEEENGGGTRPTATPTFTPTPCSRGGGGTKDSESTSRCPTRTPTRTHTPTPKPKPTVLFRASVFNVDNESVHDGAPMSWDIFQERLLRIDIETVARGTVMADYDFQLYTNPSGTGLHTYRGNPDCDGGHLFDSSNWVKGPVLHVGLTRCGLGEVRNDGVQVRGRLSPAGTPFVVTNTRNFMQATHFEGGRIGYYFNLEPIYGTRPETLSDDYFNKKILKDSAADAADALNGARSGILSEGSDIPVAAFWDGGGKCGGPPHGLACHIGFVNDRTLPHYNRAEMWVRYPPNGFVKGNPTEWTNDPNLISADREGIYYFLPQAIAHEFGHAFGLDHLSVFGENRLMWAGLREESDTIEIGEVDKDALREVTRQHGD